MFYLTLLDVPYPSKESVNEYKEMLVKSSPDGNEIGRQEFVKVECWLDKCSVEGLLDRKEFIHQQLATFDVRNYVEIV